MPEMTTFNWLLICLGFSLLTGLAVFFLKDIFKKNEKQGEDINGIQKDYATRNELNNATAALRGENKSIAGKIDRHEQDINHIKRDYATKDDMKEIRAELRGETKKLADDVAEIKENYIRKDDFYRVTADLKNDVQKVYNLLIQSERVSTRGKEG